MPFLVFWPLNRAAAPTEPMVCCWPASPAALQLPITNYKPTTPSRSTILTYPLNYPTVWCPAAAAPAPFSSPGKSTCAPLTLYNGQ